MQIRLTREELYALVWSKPMTDVAAEFGMSSVAFAKHGRKLNVPRPGRGYWQRLTVGERPRKAKLPPAKGTTPSEVVLEPHERRPARPRERASIPMVRVLASGTIDHPIAKRIDELLVADRWQDGFSTIRGSGHAVVKVGAETRTRALRILNALLKARRDAGTGSASKARRQTGRDRTGWWLSLLMFLSSSGSWRILIAIRMSSRPMSEG